MKLDTSEDLSLYDISFEIREQDKEFIKELKKRQEDRKKKLKLHIKQAKYSEDEIYKHYESLSLLCDEFLEDIKEVGGFE